jgi:hypothetical protein
VGAVALQPNSECHLFLDDETCQLDVKLGELAVLSFANFGRQVVPIHHLCYTRGSWWWLSLIPIVKPSFVVPFSVSRLIDWIVKSSMCPSKRVNLKMEQNCSVTEYGIQCVAFGSLSFNALCWHYVAVVALRNFCSFESIVISFTCRPRRG